MTIDKMPTLQQAIQRYGHIDFHAKKWIGEQQWMGLAHVPNEFPNWFVTGTKHPVSVIYSNKDMMAPLQAALYEVAARGHASALKTFDGCFNIRMVRGNPEKPSAHAYGLAIDINADDNPLGATGGGFFGMPDLVQCFTANGFDWGGNFKGRKDPMHFSYCWEHST